MVKKKSSFPYREENVEMVSVSRRFIGNNPSYSMEIITQDRTKYMEYDTPESKEIWNELYNKCFMKPPYDTNPINIEFHYINDERPLQIFEFKIPVTYPYEVVKLLEKIPNNMKKYLHPHYNITDSLKNEGIWAFVKRKEDVIYTNCVFQLEADSENNTVYFKIAPVPDIYFGVLNELREKEQEDELKELNSAILHGIYHSVIDIFYPEGDNKNTR